MSASSEFYKSLEGSPRHSWMNQERKREEAEERNRQTPEHRTAEYRRRVQGSK